MPVQPREGTLRGRRADGLPADLTRLVGRRGETSAVKRLLSESRLVTITGTGGVGKTRLAVHVARQVRAAYPGGVHFVPFAALTQPELVALSISSALPTSWGPVGTDASDLVAQIGDRDLLLVLDNCEHVVDACAAVVGQLLRSCRNLHVLTTSRERLRVSGESLLVVQPLSLPTATSTDTSSGPVPSDAVTLFLERAAANRPDLTLTVEDRQAIDVLVRRLDGLPLAIELVAGRVGSLPIPTLAARLDDWWELLPSGSRSAPERHQTLRATLDYSYELCTPRARLLWARLGVFAGGGTLDAIHTACAYGGLSAEQAEQALVELVDKSIVVFDGSRYALLSTVREYALGRLREIGEEGTARKAHRDHFLAFAEAAARSSGAQQRDGLESLLSDEVNLYAALELCGSDPQQLEVGLAAAGALWPFWVRCGRASQGRYWLDLLLSKAVRPTRARVHALWVSGQLAVHRGDMQSGLLLASECEGLAVELGDLSGIAHATYVHGSANLHLDRLRDAITDLESAVRLETARGETPVLVMSLELLGAAMCCEGEDARALEVLEEARRLSELQSDDVLLNGSLLWLGLARLLGGDLETAAGLLDRVLVQGRVIEDLLVMSTAVEFLSWVAQIAGDPARAARLMGVSQALAEPLGVHLAGFRGLHAWHTAHADAARAALGPAAFEAEFAIGRGATVHTAVDVVQQVGVRTEGQTASADASPLTRREQEIARLVATGRTNRDIAAELVISPRTVESHVEHILGKLGFTSRYQIVSMFTQLAVRDADAAREVQPTAR